MRKSLLIRSMVGLVALSLLGLSTAHALAAVAPASSGQVAPADTGKATTAAEDPFIRAIDVSGLKQVATELVLSYVKATVVGERLDPAKVRTDLQAILDTGYFSDVEAQLAPEADGVRVIFALTENPVVSKVVVETPILDGPTIRRYISQADGAVLNLAQIDEDLGSLQERVAMAHGPLVVVEEVSLSTDRELLVKIGGYKIAGFEVRGNEKTRENVILREIMQKPGDYLNMKALEADLRRVLHLGFFDEVSRVFEGTEKEDEVQVVIQVVERKTGSASFGAGYSTVDGILGYVEYAEDNFRGRGERLSLRTEFGQKKTSYDLGFYEPYLMGSKTNFGINVYNRAFERIRLDDGVENGYNERRQGGDLSLGWPLGTFTRGQVTLKIEDSQIIPDVAGSMEASSSRTRSLTVRSLTDTTDHPFYPLSGMRANLGIESAGLFLGGDTVFTKYTAETSRYFKVGQSDQVFAIRLAGGIGQGELPLQEEFRLGGADTLRGYRYGELRGDRMALMNAEYRFKIAKSLQGALFVDAGQAWQSSQGGPGPLKVGYGAGLRLDTPLGIMRLDYGIGEKGGSAFFSIGPSF